jgi:hypothetical protein
MSYQATGDATTDANAQPSLAQTGAPVSPVTNALFYVATGTSMAGALLYAFGSDKSKQAAHLMIWGGLVVDLAASFMGA